MSFAVPVYAHAAVGVGYATFALLLVLRGTRSSLNILMAAAAVATTAWAVSVSLVAVGLWPAWSAELSAALRDGAWFTVVLTILYPVTRGTGIWVALAIGTACAVLVHGIFAATGFQAGRFAGITIDAATTGVAMVVVGLILVENMIRNLPRDQFWSAKYLAIGLFCILVFQLAVRVPEFLTHKPMQALLSARPFAFLLVLPLFVVTAVRSPALQLRVHSSRKVVFHTTALICIGILLEGTALAAYYVRTYGGDNGTVLAVVLAFAGAICILIFVASTSVRSRLRKFISENFFSYKYDYRVEWDKFIRSLSAWDSDDVPLRALRTLADVVDSTGGALWVLRESWQQFMPAAKWSLRADLAPLPINDRSLSIFEDEDCVCLELDDAGENSAALEWHERFPQAWLAVPLRYRSEVIAVALVNKPRVKHRLDWEDRNLVRLVALQLAAYLVQEETTQALHDARQLEAFNKRFAFLIHDVKNMVGQLSLLVRNVEQFGDDTEFRHDMVVTLKNSVEKLQVLLARLRHDGPKPEVVRVRQQVDIAALVSTLVAEKSGLGLPVIMEEKDSVFAEVADPEAFIKVLEHVITNAVEVTPKGAPAVVRIRKTDTAVQVSVDDHGPGMTQQFITDELFRPLQTTKDGGFGIGAFQAREIMRDLGGDIQVRSKVDKGTCVALSLPAFIVAEGTAGA